MELSKKEETFVSEYLKCFNATEAYMRTHPKSKRESAWANASRLIGSDRVKERITARLNEVHMSADEALKLLADMARGDIGQFMETTTMGFELDVDAAKKAGLTKLIKRIKQRTEITSDKNGDDKEVHTQEIELYSAKDAIDTILKVAGKIAPSEINIKVNLTDD